VTATPVRDRVWTALHDAFERVARVHGEPVVLSTLAHEPGDGHPHTRFPFVLGPPGRLVAMAVGLRAALPRSPLLLVGAADAVTIGTNHLIHAARRNIGMTLVILRDDVFDPGEAALDRAGHHGPTLEPIARPLDWATALGATFVGRARAGDVDGLAAMLNEAVGSGGFSVVGVTSDPSLPAGVLSRAVWPEFFGTYRGWSDTVLADRAGAPAPPARAERPAGAPTRVEVRIAGLGGQGVKLAGAVLSEAAGAEGLWATQIGDYGAATRGGSSSVDVVFGAERITYPGADHPDVHVVLTTAAAVAPGASARVLVVDDRVQTTGDAVRLPIVSLAREHTGGQLSAGIVSLGAVAALTGWPSLDALVAAAHRKLPARAAAANIAALHEAYRITLEVAR
jgi:2-oxoglutarate ferredoxin oxidoreductase subunit gamma